MHETQLGAGRLRIPNQRPQRQIIETIGPEGGVQGLLGGNQALSCGNRLGLHLGEDPFECDHLTGRKANFVLQFQQMGRAGYPVQFGRQRQAPATAAAKLCDILVREALDRASLETGMARGMIPMACTMPILRKAKSGCQSKCQAEGHTENQVHALNPLLFASGDE
jgi:hypothetical protein